MEKENVNPFVVCDNFIKSPQGTYSVGTEWKSKINDTLKKMFDCVQTLERNETPENFSYEPVERILNFLLCIVVEQDKKDSLIEFIRMFIFIAYNINENMEKYEAVRSKIAYLQRYCDDRLTFSETLDLNRKVTMRLNHWKGWLPPSFRLSGHYYNLIKGE
jgi:hypothetical protein